MTKSHVFHILLFLFLCLRGVAQNDNLKANDTGFSPAVSADSALIVPEDFSGSLDHLLHSWAVDKDTPPDCWSQANPPTTDEQYRERLAKLPHEIEMPFNEEVKSFIEIYTRKNRREVEYMLGMSRHYFPIFEEALEKEQLPLELKILPIIESALNPTAVSRSGATGLWQFLIGTGKMYGLEVNTLVDERMNPVASSKAAVQYLKELYSIYSDWHLVIAAYNCGPGSINKAIRRAGGKPDFWAIYPYLPVQTRAYVPIFIAANYTLNYAAQHNLCPVKVRIPALTDTIMINTRMHFEQISAILKLPVEELRLLNPQYRRNIIPGDIKPYPLCLPQNYAGLMIDKKDEILAYRADILINNRRAEIEQVKPTTTAKTSEQKKEQSTLHKVKRGQTLGGIAEKYNVSVSNLKKWNNLGNSKIKTGQVLKIRHS